MKAVDAKIINVVYQFMTYRKQQVITSTGTSKWLTSSTGTPQGSVLSPTLFSLYTDELRAQNNNCYTIKYADDTVLLELCSPKTTSSLQQELSTLAFWCSSRNLIINTAKTKETVIINKRGTNNTVPLTLNGNQLEQVSEYKYLGTILDSKLTFTSNTEQMIKKARKRLYIIQRMHYYRFFFSDG